jgi:hypothetical protein
MHLERNAYFPLTDEPHRILIRKEKPLTKAPPESEGWGVFLCEKNHPSSDTLMVTPPGHRTMQPIDQIRFHT